MYIKQTQHQAHGVQIGKTPRHQMATATEKPEQGAEGPQDTEEHTSQVSKDSDHSHQPVVLAKHRNESATS